MKRNSLTEKSFGFVINNHSLFLPLIEVKHVTYILGSHLFEINLVEEHANLQFMQKIEPNDICNVCVSVPIEVEFIPDNNHVDVRFLYTFLESNWMQLNDKYIFDIPM